MIQRNMNDLAEGNRQTTNIHLIKCHGSSNSYEKASLDVIQRRIEMMGWKNAASVVTGDRKNKADVKSISWFEDSIEGIGEEGTFEDQVN